MSVPSQDYDASITWTQDWSGHLALNGLTISSIVGVTCSNGAVEIQDPTLTGVNTSVTFRVLQTGLTGPTLVTVTVEVELSNGDTDERDFPIQFTNT